MRVIFASLIMSMPALAQTTPPLPQAPLLECAGSGTPAVIIEVGSGGAKSTWAAAEPSVRALTRTCFFTRATGERYQPEQALERVSALATLLKEKDELQAVVIVGHSNGGYLARLFAQQHPDHVAGIVLIDPSDEEFYRRARDYMPADHHAMWGKSEAAIHERLRRGKLPDVPLVILTSAQLGIPASGSQGYDIEAMKRLWLETHQERAKAVPRGRHVYAEDSGHMIQRDQPALVIDAIRSVVEEARKHKK